MADQRPAFRFRLPWLPPLPPPRPAIAPRIVTPTPIRPPLPPPQETPVSAPTPTNLTPPPPLQALETQVPSQSTTQAPPQTEEAKVPTQTPPQEGAPSQTKDETQATRVTPTSTTDTQTVESQSTIQQPPTILGATPGTVGPPPSIPPEQATPSQMKDETQVTRETPTSTTDTHTVESQTTIQQPPTILGATPGTVGPPPYIPPEQATPQARIQPETTRSQLSSPSRSVAPPQSPSQPSSPSRATTAERQIPSQPPSPSRSVAPPQSTSQPSSPSRATTAQRQIPSQPPSPSRAGVPPQVVSQPSSPSRVGADTQARVTSQPSSPSRAKITSQPGSPSRAKITSKPSSPARTPSSPSRAAPQPPKTPSTSLLTSGQTSSSRSPSSTPVLHQPISDTISLSDSPKKKEPKLSQEGLQPSYTKPSLSHNINIRSNLSESEQYSMNRTYRHPIDESDLPKGFDTLDHTEKRDTSKQPKHSLLHDSKPEETKEVKEVMKEIYDNTKPAPDTPQPKEHTGFTFQAPRTHESVGGNQKEVNQTYASNGKETKHTVHPRHKTTVGDHRSKQVTSTDIPNIPLHKEIRDDISNIFHKMAIEDTKHSKNDKPVNVITLAGENRGASMHLGSDSSKRGRSIQIHRGYKIKPDENDETTTNEEESFKNKIKYEKGTENQAREAYINCNIQGINNSIVFDSSISERNPGVHIIHSHISKDETKETRRTDHHEKKHGESNTVNAHKLTHQPIVKRRCLRGLFLESSDSDSDNSSKPRRHGCRVGAGCSKNSKDNNV